MAVQYRQGDVFLMRVPELPPEAVAVDGNDNGRIVLAYGEVTGHAHAIDARCAQMYTHGDAVLLAVKETVRLVHEEHNAITLEPGYYRVTRQREYSPREVRRVSD
jgi:hypothetical protein